MSLINDALKRAKQAQQNQAKSSQAELPLLPAGKVATSHQSPAWVWAAFFALLLVACVYLAWQSLPHHNPASAGVASSNDVLIVRAAARPRPATNSAALKPGAATNAVPLVAGPPPLKLQSIILLPARPSAMINGQSLTVGGRIREFRVVEIKADHVTLASPTATKVLKLP